MPMRPPKKRTTSSKTHFASSARNVRETSCCSRAAILIFARSVSMQAQITRSALRVRLRSKRNWWPTFCETLYFFGKSVRQTCQCTTHYAHVLVYMLIRFPLIGIHKPTRTSPFEQQVGTTDNRCVKSQEK